MHFRESAFERFNRFVFETDQFAKYIFTVIIFLEGTFAPRGPGFIYSYADFCV